MWIQAKFAPPRTCRVNSRGPEEMKYWKRVSMASCGAKRPQSDQSDRYLCKLACESIFLIAPASCHEADAYKSFEACTLPLCPYLGSPSDSSLWCKLPLLPIGSSCWNHRQFRVLFHHESEQEHAPSPSLYIHPR